MARQTSVAMGLAVAVAGLVREFFKKTRSYINSTPMQVTFTVSAANAATTVTINGTAVTVNSGAETKTTAQLAAMLVTAINAANLGVTATQIASGATLRVVADVPGTAFTYAATANTSVALNVPNAGNIPFGRFVAQSAINPGRCYLPVASTDITSIKSAAGVAVRSDSIENGDDEGYPLNEAVEVLSAGVVWVPVEEAVTPASDVYVRYAARGLNTELGTFRTDSDSSTAAALPSARWLTSAGAGELALLEINLP